MGTTVEQTFAALRQESEELQRLQVLGNSGRHAHRATPATCFALGTLGGSKGLRQEKLRAEGGGEGGWQAEAVARASGVGGHVLDFVIDGGMCAAPRRAAPK